MDSQEVGDLLEECLRAVAAAPQSTRPTEAQRLDYCSCRGQTQDGAVWSVFIWVLEDDGLEFGWGDLEVELHKPLKISLYFQTPIKKEKSQTGQKERQNTHYF